MCGKQSFSVLVFLGYWNYKYLPPPPLMMRVWRGLCGMHLAFRILWICFPLSPWSFFSFSQMMDGKRGMRVERERVFNGPGLEAVHITSAYIQNSVMWQHLTAICKGSLTFEPGHVPPKKRNTGGFCHNVQKRNNLCHFIL